ncbi:hypothetical protein PoB_003086900 [Plakobranchus ocellatus]|uniref:Uncharacterized protein n=1 Tax=Plakobranchus ocellatus TaxID=259542 RepID=A0AAV4ADP8_9GAST|nr:hypothetical protein PoB_003086900 [Plakobranchus ocellatus]
MHRNVREGRGERGAKAVGLKLVPSGCTHGEPNNNTTQRSSCIIALGHIGSRVTRGNTQGKNFSNATLKTTAGYFQTGIATVATCFGFTAWLLRPRDNGKFVRSCTLAGSLEEWGIGFFARNAGGRQSWLQVVAD